MPPASGGVGGTSRRTRENLPIALDHVDDLVRGDVLPQEHLAVVDLVFIEDAPDGQGRVGPQLCERHLGKRIMGECGGFLFRTWGRWRQDCVHRTWWRALEGTPPS